MLRIVIAAAFACSACSKTSEKPAPATPAAEQTPAPAQPPGLFPGMGNHHHQIATSSPEAQTFFDQGMALVFGFNHEEAVRSFQRAAALDPKASMPHWGIAWALGPNYNLDIDDPRAKQAFDAITQAKSLSAEGPAIERAYIAAMATRYVEDMKADRTQLARRYVAAMRDLMHQYPDDLDAATLYAESLMNLRPWKLWNLTGTPAEGTTEIVTVLQGVLKRDPNHLGANHYYIHTVEASPHPEDALPSATRLAALAPAAGHLTHMPAHILARTGDQAGAARANLAGAEADRVYLKTAPPDAFYGMAYYPHNLHFLADSEMMRGRFAEAKKAADEVAALLGPHTDVMPMVESLIVMPTSVLMRFGRHQEILALPEAPAGQPVVRAWQQFAKGVSLARTGKTTEAMAARAALAKAMAETPDSALFGGTGLESAKTVLAVAASVLDARIAWARGGRAESIAAWTKAVAAADRLPYDEPPVWFYPLRESLGAALLLDGKAADAERVFREDLARHPRNARSLFGLHESLLKQGKDGDAAWVKRQFDEAWKDADSPLTIDAL
jgi:tetratricopeptide (TPR) repeat protein